MSPVFSARRRADEFDTLVEAAASGRAVDDARFSELLEVVGALREAPQPQARPQFVGDLRERLMTAAATELAPQPVRATPATADRLTVAPRRTKRERRVAIAVGGFAIVGATASMSVAAQSALPGDVLYPLKRALENAQTGVSVGEASKGSTLLANASGRLEEVDALSRSQDAEDLAAISQTLVDFTQQTTEASNLLLDDYAQNGDEASIDELRDFTTTSMAALDGLAAVLPATAQPALLEAGNLLAEIDLTTQSVCPSCSGRLIDQLPAFLLAAVEDIAAELSTDGASTSPAPTQQARPGKDSSTEPRPSTTPAPTTQAGPTPGPLGGQPSVPSGNGGGQGGGQGEENPLDGLGDLLGGGTNTGGTNPGPGTPTALPSTLDEVVDPLLGTVGEIVDPLLPGGKQDDKE